MSTTTSSAAPFLLQAVSLLFMIGSVRGAILLLKDAMKHKKFAKVIRIITGIVQLLAIISSTIILIIALINPQGVVTLASLGGIMTIILGISLLSIVTNIRGGILLFIESSRLKKFAKYIRIICGVIMIVSLFMSFIFGA